MQTKKTTNTMLLSAVLTILISVSACTPTVVVPQIAYKSHAVFENEIRGHKAQCLNSLEQMKTAEPGELEDIALDTIFCFEKLYLQCDGEYQVWDAQMETLKEDEGN